MKLAAMLELVAWGRLRAGYEEAMIVYRLFSNWHADIEYIEREYANSLPDACLIRFCALGVAKTSFAAIDVTRKSERLALPTYLFYISFPVPIHSRR